MARDHEVEVDCVVHTSQDPPHQILQHGIVFVLPSTVVCVQAHSRFPKAIVLKKVVEKTNYSVGSFSCVTSFINDEVYLPWDSFTANAKDGRLLRCKEVNWPGCSGLLG